MPRSDYLKDSYKWHIRAVLVINVVAFWVVVVWHANLSQIVAVLESVSLKEGLLGLTSSVGAFVLDGLLSADAKARVVYWRLRHPLPGSRAFSEHLRTENRADPDSLENSWGRLPSDPAQQNRLWYRIYRSVEEESRVREAHRSWLFSRDLASHAFLFAVLFGVGALISDAPWNTAVTYLVALALQFTVAVAAARTYGVRFVCTVLAVASHPPHSLGRNTMSAK